MIKQRGKSKPGIENSEPTWTLRRQKGKDLLWKVDEEKSDEMFIEKNKKWHLQWKEKMYRDRKNTLKKTNLVWELNAGKGNGNKNEEKKEKR